MKRLLVPLDELKKLYLDDGLPCKIIAERMGISAATVKRYLSPLGIMRSPSEAYKLGFAQGRIKPSGCVKPHLTLPIEDIISGYVNDQKSVVQLAREYGVSYEAIAYRLRKSNIEIRGRSEARRITYEKGRWKPWNLKGDKVKDNRGYVLVRIEGGKRKGEHILVWEQSQGRPLPKGWVIHHINGKRDDNRIDNLIAMPRKQHSPYLLLRAVQKRLRQVEQELKKEREKRSLFDV